MTIIPVNKTTIDVFLGNGWETWGRFKLSHKEKTIRCYQVAGNRFNKEEVSTIENKVNE